MPKMTEQEFKKHITQNEFNNLYVIFGEEKLLVKHYTEKLVEKIAGKKPDEFGYHIFDNNSLIEQIADAVGIVPFLSQYNCVKITDLDCDSLKADDLEKFLEIIKNIPSSTIVIISMPTLEQDAKKIGKFKKVIDIATKTGAVIELNKKGLLEIERQLGTWANKRGCSISQACCGKIIDYCGTDLLNLQNELDKLCAYADGGEITLEYIEKLVTKNFEAKIYALSDSVIACKSDLAFKQLDTLFYQREEPIAIVSVLAGAYIDIYRARVAAESGEPMKTVIDAFNYKNRAFVLDKAQRNARSLSTVAVRKSLDVIINADTQLKSVSVNQRLLVEKLVAQLLIVASEG